ncbi:hypothetical protein D918_04628 [Trichuris suis]|nr:hypothetical protein D918_04628 [Trichuris suis]
MALHPTSEPKFATCPFFISTLIFKFFSLHEFLISFLPSGKFPIILSTFLKFSFSCPLSIHWDVQSAFCSISVYCCRLGFGKCQLLTFNGYLQRFHVDWGLYSFFDYHYQLNSSNAKIVQGNYRRGRPLSSNANSAGRGLFVQVNTCSIGRKKRRSKVR